MVCSTLALTLACCSCPPWGHEWFNVRKRALTDWGVLVVKNEGPDFYVEVERVPVPEIGRLSLLSRRVESVDADRAGGEVDADEVLIKLNATGLCLSDVHFMMNDWKLPKMSELGTTCAGHEVRRRLRDNIRTYG